MTHHDTATNPYPVDSATRPCCKGIGGHTQSCTTNETRIVVCDEPDERNVVVCIPFEPHDPEYAGERYLGLFYRGTEESFVVLSADQAAQLAELLTKNVEVSR